jgi:hypothetical protein
VELIKQACTAESAEMADVYRSRTPEAVQTPELVEAVEVPIPQCASLISKVKVASEAHIASCSSFIQKLTNELKKITSRGLASLTPTTAISHVITVNENAQPIKQKMRLVPYNLKDELKRTLMDMKNAGIIKDSKSPWSSPVRLVRKKDGSLRVTTNYRKLNNVTVKDSYPIPRIDEMINQLAKAKVYTTLDLASGYYQVPIEPDSAQYTAFACEFGFFEYNVMPMGLTNATATFQRLMNQVLDGLIGICCFVYLDDIIIFSENQEQHLEHVRLVVERLQQYTLKIKMEKCRVGQESIEFLSHVISNGEVKASPAKIEALYRFNTPKSVKEVQSFLGLASYYRKYIPNFSTIASPLIRCTMKCKTLIWDSNCQKAFDILREYLVSDRILRLPDFDKQFRVDTDASNYGVGGVISQIDGTNWRPVAYFSRHLSRREQNYSTTERELLAVVLSV